MSTATVKRDSRSGAAGRDYLALVRAFPLRPIRDDAENDRRASSNVLVEVHGSKESRGAQGAVPKGAAA